MPKHKKKSFDYSSSQGYPRESPKKRESFQKLIPPANGTSLSNGKDIYYNRKTADVYF